MRRARIAANRAFTETITIPEEQGNGHGVAAEVTPGPDHGPDAASLFPGTAPETSQVK
jgi:hypothetical protein